MAENLRSFFDLLPHRVEQSLSGNSIRRTRVWLQRKWPIRPIPREAARARRLYVDLAVISKHDAGTGIQRVVRALALGLLDQAPEGWEICWVSATRRRQYHRIAWPGPLFIGAEDEVMEVRAGDVFVGLDYSLDTIRWHRRQLARFRRGGGELWFLVHDLLPLNRPDWFSTNTIIRYRAWLCILANLANGFLCNSAQTETELKSVLKRMYGLEEGYRTSVLPMGFGILDGVTREADGVSSSRIDPVSPFFLMVGTLEPRKGHSDIIRAFDRMWAEGQPDRLVLVGRLGWQVEGLHEQILTHPEYGSRLLWFNDVGDAELHLIYQECEGVIIASRAEGFGLPLIEALGHGRPVLARDLPIFRVHAERGVRYFPADADAAALAGHIETWRDSVRAGHVAVVRPEADWADAAQVLLSSVIDR